MKRTWSKTFDNFLFTNKSKLNFVWIVSAITIGAVWFSSGTRDIVSAGAVGIGGAFVGFLGFGFICGLACGIRDEARRRREERKRSNSYKAKEEDV